MSFNQTDLGNMGNTLQLTAAGAASINVAVANAIGARGIKAKIWINGAPTGTTPTMTVTLQGVDLISGQKWTLIVSAALNASGFTVLTVYPGLTAAANLTVSDVIPQNLNVNIAFGGTTPRFTGNISLELLP